MANISYSDSLFVTVLLRGASLLNVSLSGFNSLGELLKHLHGLLARYAGQILTLEVRNSTRGWSKTQPLLFAA